MMTTLLLAEEQSNSAKIFLDGQLAGFLALQWSDYLRQVDVELVERLLSSKGFDYEFDEEAERAARRYGRMLWQAIQRSVVDIALRRSIQSAHALEVVVKGEAIHQPAWELLNSGTIRRPRWVCLEGNVARIGPSRAPKEEVPAAAGRDIVLVTARPYAAADVPFDLLPVAIARSLEGSDRASLRCLLGASRRRLEQVTLPKRPWILHIDAHAVTHATAGPSVIDHPHILLEARTGPDPCDITELLRLYGAAAPDLLLLTSCGTDVRAVAPWLTMQGQAIGAGIKGVVLSRRRLTPAEVTVFSSHFYRSLAEGSSVSSALANARLKLLRNAKRNPQVGRLAWASFTYYVSSEDALLGFCQRIQVDRSPVSNFPHIPPWVPAVIRQPDYVIVQRTAEEAASELEAAHRWASVLIPRLQIGNDAAEDDYAPTASLRVTDLTGATSPRAMLEAGPPLLPVVPRRDSASLRSVPASRNGSSRFFD